MTAPREPMDLNTTPPNDCPSWRRLEAHAEQWRRVTLAELFANDAARPRQLRAEAPGVQLDYSRQRVGALTLRLLSQLAAERGFDAWRDALFAGAALNHTEGRAVGHVLARAERPAPALRRDPTTYRRIVNLGTGGSDLGARLLADAFADTPGEARPDLRFVANIDPLELDRALAGADPADTLLVVVSKSFTTEETLANAAEARRRGFRECVAVTADAGAAHAFGVQEVLDMPVSVGGRFSVWTNASLAAQIAVGPAAFAEFLAGGRDIDEHFRSAPPEANMPLLMALLGVWNVNFLGLNAHAVLPYAHRLRHLPAYLQQLEMESNGKGVDREGRALAYATAPVVFGAEGTPAQHAFLQRLHQGAADSAIDFIDASAGNALTANLRAQADALAFGTSGSDAALPPHRRHPGNRPSSVLTFRAFGPRDLGRLIALYEHKVFAQGVLWNVNSFDQWGVELGKQLARQHF